MINSNRFWLVVIGVLFAIFVMILVAFIPEDQSDRVDVIVGMLPWVEGLLGLGIASDTKRRMGGERDSSS